MAALLALTVLRKLADVTQEELSEALGVHQTTLSGWESGTYPLPNRQASRILKILRPRLRLLVMEVSPAQARIIQNLGATQLRKPWDELLVDTAIELTQDAV
jgi:transcriptional regulator with XRE-family HTH domain